MRFQLSFRAVAVFLLAFTLAFDGRGVVLAQGPLPQGFTPHYRPAKDGEIDWARGYVQARGYGKARGRSPQDKQMARRAAELVAVRNAMAITMGIQVDEQGRLSGIRNGRHRIQGIVKGHETYLVDWQPNETPPRCKVKVRVPLWGIKGVGSIVYDDQRRVATRRGRHLTLVRQQVDVSETLLIIDARGTGIDPCMFPAVIDNTGRVIYDVSTIESVGRRPCPVQYVETRMSVEELEAWAELEFDESKLAHAGESGLTGSDLFMREMFGNAHDQEGLPAFASFGPQEKGRAASQPTTKPADTSRRRKKRVVQAVKAGAKGDTKIVLTKDDAEKLATTPEGASLLRSGKVIVVVDSVAAGIQGRIDRPEDDPQLALER